MLHAPGAFIGTYTTRVFGRPVKVSRMRVLRDYKGRRRMSGYVVSGGSTRGAISGKGEKKRSQKMQMLLALMFGIEQVQRMRRAISQGSIRMPMAWPMILSLALQRK